MLLGVVHDPDEANKIIKKGWRLLEQMRTTGTDIDDKMLDIEFRNTNLFFADRTPLNVLRERAQQKATQNGAVEVKDVG